MPIDAHIPPEVVLHLELIGRLLYQLDGLDSMSIEAKIIQNELAFYLDEIRDAMKIAVQDEVTGD